MQKCKKSISILFHISENIVFSCQQWHLICDDNLFHGWVTFFERQRGLKENVPNWPLSALISLLWMNEWVNAWIKNEWKVVCSISFWMKSARMGLTVLQVDSNGSTQVNLSCWSLLHSGHLQESSNQPWFDYQIWIRLELLVSLRLAYLRIKLQQLLEFPAVWSLS